MDRLLARKMIAALAAFAACAGWAQIDAQTGAPVVRLAEPLLIVSPRYPKNAPSDKKQVEVRVTGLITEKGDFGSPAYAANPGEDAFVEAVREVLPHWRFEPDIDNAACKPKAYEARLSIWFEMTGDGPSISGSMPTAAPQPRNLPPDAQHKRGILKRYPNMTYPREAWRKGVEGKAIVLFKVDGRTGRVLHASIGAYSPNEVFNKEALEYAREFEFHPLDPGWGEAPCLRWEFLYCMPRSDMVGIADAQCRRNRARGSQAEKFKRGDSLFWKSAEP
jgi:TonB family protein